MQFGWWFEHNGSYAFSPSRQRLFFTPDGYLMTSGQVATRGICPGSHRDKSGWIFIVIHITNIQQTAKDKTWITSQINAINGSERRFVVFYTAVLWLMSHQLPPYPLYLCDTNHIKGRWLDSLTIQCQISQYLQGPATSAATLTKPRASSLRDSKHKKGCFYVIRY